jgi:3-hydroxyisobutyrate dehydrogenase
VTRVGFIGLGNQGAPMARRIIDAGLPTTLYARRRATLGPFGNSGAIAASRPSWLRPATSCASVSPMTPPSRTLINNLLFTAQLATASGALVLAESFGVEPGSLAGVLAHGSAASHALDVTAALGGSARAMSQQAAAPLQKDVGLVVDLAGGAQAVPAGVLWPADQALELMGRPR